jgi:hypothetical protein
VKKNALPRQVGLIDRDKMGHNAAQTVLVYTQVFVLCRLIPQCPTYLLDLFYAQAYTLIRACSVNMHKAIFLTLY